MQTLRFKTNIKCGGCIAAVSPYLDNEKGIQSWRVDINDADKPLSVQTDLDAPSVQDLIKKAGYAAEPLL